MYRQSPTEALREKVAQRKAEKGRKKTQIVQRLQKKYGIQATPEEEVVRTSTNITAEGQRLDQNRKPIEGVKATDTYAPETVTEAALAGAAPSQQRSTAFVQSGPTPFPQSFGGIFGQPVETPRLGSLRGPADDVRPPAGLSIPGADRPVTVPEVPNPATTTGLPSSTSLAEKFSHDFRERHGDTPTQKHDMSWWKAGLTNMADALGRVNPETFSHNPAVGLGMALGGFGGGAIFQDGVETRDLVRRQGAWNNAYDEGLKRALAVDKSVNEARTIGLSGQRAAATAATSATNAATNAGRLQRQLNQDVVRNFSEAAKLFMRTAGVNGLTASQAESFNRQFGETLGFTVGEGYRFKADPAGRGVVIYDTDDNALLVNPVSGEAKNITAEGRIVKGRKPTPLISMEAQDAEKTATDTAQAQAPQIRQRIEGEYRQRLVDRFTREASGRDFDDDAQRQRWIISKVEKEMQKVDGDINAKVNEEVKANAAKGRNQVRVNRSKRVASGGSNPQSRYRGKSYDEVIYGSKD